MKLPRPLRRALYSDFAWRRLTEAHVRAYRLSGGRIGGRVRGVDILLLEHTGRKSSKHHVTPLLYISDGENFVIVASKGGSPQHPLWWLNLRAEPQATVQVGSRRFGVRAREATDGERERLWPRLVAVWPDYQRYQRRTDRRIPVVVLEPRA